MGARLVHEVLYVLRALRIDALDPREVGSLRAQLEGVAIALVKGPVGDHVRRILDTGAGVDLFTPVRLRHDGLAAFRMPPGLELVDETIANLLVVSARLDDAPGLTSPEVHPEHRIVRILLEVGLGALPVDHSVAYL